MSRAMLSVPMTKILSPFRSLPIAEIRVFDVARQELVRSGYQALGMLYTTLQAARYAVGKRYIEGATVTPSEADE